MMLELYVDEKHRAKGSTSETRMSNRWVQHVMRAALQACERNAFRRSVRHIVQHRQSRDGQIQLTTHQPRGQHRTQVLFKAADMCSVACVGSAFGRSNSVRHIICKPSLDHHLCTRHVYENGTPCVFKGVPRRKGKMCSGTQPFNVRI